MQNILIGCWLVEIDLRSVSETFFTHAGLGDLVCNSVTRRSVKQQEERNNRVQYRAGQRGIHGYNKIDAGYIRQLLLQPDPLEHPFRGQEPIQNGSASLYKELDKLSDS